MLWAATVPIEMMRMLWAATVPIEMKPFTI
jgi:hypothetical protein